MDVVQHPQKSSGYDQGPTMRKNVCVVTPRCAAAAVVSAVVLRRPTKEYTHRHSMMRPRLATAGIEVAPHFNQLLVADKSAACGRETHRKGISTEYHTDTHETENKCGVRRVTDA